MVVGRHALYLRSARIELDPFEAIGKCPIENQAKRLWHVGLFVHTLGAARTDFGLQEGAVVVGIDDVPVVHRGTRLKVAEIQQRLGIEV